MKWFGVIGYSNTIETDPGVWEDSIIEKQYYGEIYRNSRRLQNSNQGVNDDVNISNQLSIISDPFSSQNIHAMRYAEFMGSKWKISDVEVNFPRLTITLGGIYNDEIRTTE